MSAPHFPPQADSRLATPAEAGWFQDGPTKRQRHALYRFGLSRRRVHSLTKAQASRLLEVLIEAIPQRTYERLQAPTGTRLEGLEGAAAHRN